MKIIKHNYKGYIIKKRSVPQFFNNTYKTTELYEAFLGDIISRDIFSEYKLRDVKTNIDKHLEKKERENI